MKLNEIMNPASTFMTDEEQIIKWFNNNTTLWPSDLHIKEDGIVDVTRDIRMSSGVDELPMQIGTVRGNIVFPMDSKIKSVKGFPLECDMIDLQGCMHITTLQGLPTIKCSVLDLQGTNISRLEDILPHVKFELTTLRLEGSKVRSFTNVEKMTQSLQVVTIYNEKEDFTGLLSLVLVPTMKTITCSEIFNRSAEDGEPQRRAIAIISKYLGHPEDVFECQAELIDNGLDKFAEL